MGYRNYAEGDFEQMDERDLEHGGWSRRRWGKKGRGRGRRPRVVKYYMCGCGEHDHYGHGPGAHMHGEFGPEGHRHDMMARRMFKHGGPVPGAFGFRRRFVSREERAARLEAYLNDLQAEAKAVEERIEELRNGAPSDDE